MAEYNKNKKYIQSVERAMSILDFIADRGSVRLSAISEYAGLRPSTTHGLLQTLEHTGFVAKRPGSTEYSLGLGSLKVGLAFSQTSAFRDNIHDVLCEMVKAIDETAYFEIKVGRRYYYYDVVLSTKPLKVVPDSDHFIDLPQSSAVAQVYSGLTDGLPYAMDLEGVDEGLNCFAVPFYAGDTLAGCISLSGPSCRLTEQKMEEAYQVYRDVMTRLNLERHLYPSSDRRETP